MIHSKIIAGVTVFVMYGFLSFVILGNKALRISFPAFTSQTQNTKVLLDQVTLCESARQLVKWICGDFTSVGILQMTEGFADKVDWETWDILEPLITQSMIEIDIILDPGKTPSLNPFDAGSNALAPNTTSMTTDDMGDDLCDRARRAMEEICNSNDPDHEYAGTLIRQMRWVLEDLYEQAQP